MSEQQIPKSPTPFEVFEKALLKAMLKHRRVFVTREEATECLPAETPPSGVGRVDIANYLFNYYEYGPTSDVITFPELLQQLSSAELDVFQHLLDTMVLDIDLDVFNRLVLEYINYTKFVHYNYWVNLLLEKAVKYFRIEDRSDGQDSGYDRREVFDGEEFVTSIKRHCESGEYFFYRVSSTGAVVPEGEL